MIRKNPSTSAAKAGLDKCMGKLPPATQRNAKGAGGERARTHRSCLLIAKAGLDKCTCKLPSATQPNAKGAGGEKAHTIHSFGTTHASQTRRKWIRLGEGAFKTLIHTLSREEARHPPSLRTRPGKRVHKTRLLQSPSENDHKDQERQKECSCCSSFFFHHPP